MGQLSSTDVGVWVLALGVFASLMVNLKAIFIRTPSLREEFVARSEFEKFQEFVQEDLESMRTKMDSDTRFLGGKIDDMQSELLIAGEHRAKAIHERINTVEGMVARLDERTHGAK